MIKYLVTVKPFLLHNSYEVFEFKCHRAGNFSLFASVGWACKNSMNSISSLNRDPLAIE